MKRLGRCLIALLVLIYPALIYFGLTQFQPRSLALLLAALALLRAWMAKERIWLLAAIAALALAAIAAVANHPLALKLYPALVNALMLGLFAGSLLQGPTVVERLARLSEPELSPRALRYTRRVTQVWCLFFILNGSVALYTALYSTDAVWALYNGGIAYALIGLLFAIEWLVRQRVRRDD